MNIKKKLEIVDILFKTMDGDELTNEDIEQVLTSMVQNKIKKKAYRENMVKKYGKDVFKIRAGKAGKTKKGE